MLTLDLFRRSILPLCVIGAGLAISAPAFAQKDIPYPSAASATVSSTPVAVSNNFVTGADGSTTIDDAVFSGQQVVVTATWSIQDRELGPGQDTDYGSGLTIEFASSTSVTPGPLVSVDAISDCTVASAASTCTRSISFSAPATPGNYQVTVTLSGTGFSGPNGLADPGKLYVNFSVAEPVVLLDTKLTVAQQCVLLNAGEIALSATLEESVSTDPIAGATIDFFVNPGLDLNGDPTVPSVGSGTTDASGTATLTYNVNGLAVGNHNLYAEYAGDSDHNPSNDSNILGINYLFAGFRPPVNADGTSIFGGRVIPIKIKLVDANGEPVTDAAPTVWLTSFDKDMGLGEELEQTASVSSADTGNIMRYVPDDQQYIYNWDAKDLENGTYAVVVELGDSSACRAENPYAIFTVAKKGGKK